MPNANIRYMHFQTNKGKGYATFVLSWDKVSLSNAKNANASTILEANVGVSFCSPLDQFAKNVGKTKALNRSVSSDKFVVRVMASNSRYITNADFQRVVSEILKSTAKKNKIEGDHRGLIPTWARRAFKAKRFGFGTKQQEDLQQNENPQE